jgi:hypothetical protein
MKHKYQPVMKLNKLTEVNNVICWYCFCDINGVFFAIPCEASEVLDGFYCSPSCAKSAIIQTSHSFSNILSRANYIYFHFYNVDLHKVATVTAQHVNKHMVPATMIQQTEPKFGMHHIRRPELMIDEHTRIKSVKCWYCATLFSGTFFTLPHNNSMDSPVVYGFFCSPECAKIYITEFQVSNQLLLNSCKYLFFNYYHLIFSDIPSKKKRIHFPRFIPENWDIGIEKNIEIQQPFKPLDQIIFSKDKQNY